MLRAISHLVNQDALLLTASSVFVLALLIRWFFLHQKHSWIGVLVGLLAIFAFWAITLYVIIPPPERCEIPLACEWLGIGIFMFTFYTLVMVAIYIICAFALGILYRVTLSRSRVASSARVLVTVFIILSLSTVMGLGLAITVIDVAQSGLFIPWQKVSNPPLIPQERLRRIVGATFWLVQVETSMGNVYESRIDEWFYGRGMNWNKRPTLEGTPWTQLQQCEIGFLQPPLFGKVIDQASARNCDVESQLAQTNYAIMDDNTLWVWHRNVDPRLFPNYAYAALFGPPLGFLIGLTVAIVFEKRARANGRV